MKNNLYTNKLSKITAPSELVNTAVKSLPSDNIEYEVISFEKPKHRALKFTSAVAAVLALIIGLSFIPFGSSNTPDNEHDFVITVGAAEIKPDVYVEIGELVEYASGARFTEIEGNKYNQSWDDDMNFESAFNLNDKNTQVPDDIWTNGVYNLMEIHRMFMPQDINIDGENIESITYSVKNCRLVYDSQFEGVIDADILSNEDLVSNGENVIRYYNGYGWAKSCTLDYAIQKESIQNGEWQGTSKLGIEFAMKFKEGEHVVYIEKNRHDEAPLFESEFNTNADDYELLITANFKDGKSATKTLKFKCENTNNRGLVLYAKEN